MSEKERATGKALAEEFQNHLKADGKADSTIESYVTDVTGFLDWYETKSGPFDGRLKRFHVTSYRSHLVTAGFSTATVNKKINSLQSFNGFLLDAGYCIEQAVDPARDKVKVAKGSEKEVEVLTEQEAERLIFHISDRKKADTREQLIVTMLLFTGLRVSELVNVRLKDIDFLTSTLTVAWGKGGKLREVPLRPEVTEAIREYLNTDRKQNSHCSSDYLLLTQRAGKMDRDTVNKILKKIGSETGLSLHPHKFRHTFCTRLVKRGVELTTVAKLAGHAGINTTAAYYVNTSREDKQNAVALL